jgi:hypothetical protein
MKQECIISVVGPDGKLTTYFGEVHSFVETTGLRRYPEIAFDVRRAIKVTAASHAAHVTDDDAALFALWKMGQP